MSGFQVKIGTFGDDNTAEIWVDGKSVGWLERVHGERFKSVSSYARVKYVSHYSIVFTDEEIETQLKKHDVAARSDAKREIRRACDRAWERGSLAPAGTKSRDPSAVPGYSNYGGGGPFAPMGAPKLTPATKKRTR